MPLTFATYSTDQIEARLSQSTRLPSLKSINLALQELMNSEGADAAEIGDLIQRDPSMTTRILKLVNSVSFGINYKVKTVQEAVIFLGMRHVRQVALLSPVIDEFQNLPLDKDFSWRNFWKHCLAVALLTQEVLSEEYPELADLGYISGLIHDLGKIATAYVFPDHFSSVYHSSFFQEPSDLIHQEEATIGANHSEIGAIYAETQNIESCFIDAIRFHHEPKNAKSDPFLASAIQIADGITHHLGIGASGVHWGISNKDCIRLSGWKILFPHFNREQREAHLHKLVKHAGHLHEIVDNMV